MGKNGGTMMHCPSCGTTTVCKAISLSSLGEKAGQRWYMKQHTDIQWFRRGRECKGCGFKFKTSEIDEKFIEELVELRDALGNIKRNAEQYVIEAEKASTSLDEFTNSLELLRALDIYKQS